MPSASNRKKTIPAKVVRRTAGGGDPASTAQSRHVFWGDVAAFSETAMRIVSGARWVEAARRDALVRNPDGSESKFQHAEGLTELMRRSRSFGRFMADQINAPHGAEFLRLGAEWVTAVKEMALSIEDLPVFAPPTEISKTLREEKESSSRRTADPRRKLDERNLVAAPRLTGFPRDPTRLRVFVRASVVLRKDPGHRFLIREVRGWFVGAKNAPSDKTIQRVIKELNLKPASRGAPRGTLQKRR